MTDPIGNIALVAFIIMLLALGSLIVIARRIERLIDMIERRGK